MMLFINRTLKHICVNGAGYQLVYGVTALSRDHIDVIHRARPVGWYGTINNKNNAKTVIV